MICRLYPLLSGLMLITILSGCSSKYQTSSCALPDEDGKKIKKQSETLPTTKGVGFPYKPIIGTRNNDAKTVVDMGTVLKIYIPSYKDSKRSLVAAHDRYVVAKELEFIIGADKPTKRKRTGLITPKGSVPFEFNGGEIDKSGIEDNSRIKDYIQAVSSVDINATATDQKMQAGNTLFDNKIKGFLDALKK